MSNATLPLDAPTFNFVRKLLRDHAAIALEADKEYLVESRLLPVARQAGLKSVAELVAQLRRRPVGELHQQVVEAMTTNETSFFRDFHPFEALKTDVLPPLIAARRAERTLHIWSAACSSGQEPYSIAMLLAEHFPELDHWNVRIHATDLAQHVLSRAVAGDYSQLELSRGLPPAFRDKYFEQRGRQWRIKLQIRRRVTFARANLTADLPALARLDIVFLRNVLIYLTPEARRRILAKIKPRLAEGGVLLLGGAETTLGIDDDWVRVSHGKGSTYRLAHNP